MSTYDRIVNKKEFEVSGQWMEIKTIDMHTGGEPLRVIVDGFPNLKGETVLERLAYCREHQDHLRTALMWEPRGHADMYGCLLVPPNDPEGDFGIIFMHNEGYSTMCGHSIIAISTLAVQMSWIDYRDGINEILIDAPCGRIRSFVNVLDSKVESVSFHCVPSFVLEYDQSINLSSGENVSYDLAYGGAFYAYVDMAKNDLPFDLSKENYSHIISYGKAIKKAIIDSGKDISHPFEEALSFLYGVIFIDNNTGKNNIDSRNVCVFADGEVDRCPTGSGVSGRMAIHHGRGEIKIGEKMFIESITDSLFEGSVVEETKFGNYEAVIPQVKGTAHITGVNRFVIDPDDPMNEGFLLR